ncbi:hypothetical protein CRG98_023705 [Punica granatum]|uniref:Uncharacterized protein n=1 Tax=Punica granatum TaxID=22663 RepID=A0A2I0JHZ8_PUNGR|nr:hypothetical protein CRG98_023705 [Punica granatum]
MELKPIFSRVTETRTLKLKMIQRTDRQRQAVRRLCPLLPPPNNTLLYKNCRSGPRPSRATPESRVGVVPAWGPFRGCRVRAHEAATTTTTFPPSSGGRVQRLRELEHGLQYPDLDLAPSRREPLLLRRLVRGTGGWRVHFRRTADRS